MAKLGSGYSSLNNFWTSSFYTGQLYQCKIYDGYPEQGGELKEIVLPKDCALRTREMEENKKKRGRPFRKSNEGI